jgi:hypothetical protein
MFLPGYGPIAIADWSIIVQCHILGFSVVEMGVLSTLKRLLMESLLLHVALHPDKAFSHASRSECEIAFGVTVTYYL